MLENLTDEQFKGLIVFTICIAPMIISGMVYWLTEKIENRIRFRKKARK